MIKSYKDLDVYNESYELAVRINKEVLKLPNYERSDLASQLRRASKSIPANIAEGFAKRQFSKEFIKHLIVALGSANEMEVHINFARDLNFWTKDFCEEVLDKYQILGRKLNRLIQKWQSF